MLLPTCTCITLVFLCFLNVKNARWMHQTRICCFLYLFALSLLPIFFCDFHKLWFTFHYSLNAMVPMQNKHLIVRNIYIFFFIFSSFFSLHSRSFHIKSITDGTVNMCIRFKVQTYADYFFLFVIYQRVGVDGDNAFNADIAGNRKRTKQNKKKKKKVIKMLFHYMTYRTT